MNTIQAFNPNKIIFGMNADQKTAKVADYAKALANGMAAHGSLDKVYITKDGFAKTCFDTAEALVAEEESRKAKYEEKETPYTPDIGKA